MEARINSDERFNRFIAWALAAHIAVVSIAYLSTHISFFNSEKTVVNNVDLIRSAVKVDVVGMPKLTVQELKKIKYIPTNSDEVEQVAEKKVGPTKETSKVEFKKVAKEVDLSNLLNNLSQKSIPKKRVKKNKNKKIDKKLLRKLILEGNKVSAGTSTLGEKTEVSEQAFVAYLQRIPQKVRPFWKLPSYLLNKDLRCRIRVFLGRGGKILKTEIFESSGVSEFDKKALGAVMASAPFPPPPKDILVRVASGEVIVGFPL